MSLMASRLLEGERSVHPKLRDQFMHCRLQLVFHISQSANGRKEMTTFVVVASVVISILGLATGIYSVLADRKYKARKSDAERQ